MLAAGRPGGLLRELGFVREGVMRGYVDDDLVGADCELWSLVDT